MLWSHLQVSRIAGRAQPSLCGFAAQVNSGYGWGMTVDAIKDAIAQLPEQDRRQLTHWLEEMEEQAWDRQMEQDFAPGGRGAHLLEKVDRQIDTGNFPSLEEGLRQRREQRSK
jgi:Arc/MetJ-type ribon-helix-helix transcriptional regulator